MLLNTSDGIRCDRCYKSFTENFIYYSYDVRERVVTNNILPSPELKTIPTFSFDMCESCMVELGELVKKHYTPTKSPSNRLYPNGIYCDLSGNHLKGNYTFYHVAISKVQVQITGKQIVCDKCKTPTLDSSVPCSKCGHDGFSRHADTVVDDRYLELLVCNEVYENFKERAIALRQNPEAAEWSQ
jgi:hypothetical protein